MKTLWNDGGASLGQRLSDLGVALPAGFPLQNWATYQLISFPNSEVEQQCKRSLEARRCIKDSFGSFVVPSVVNSNKLCVSVAMTEGNWATCYPAKVNAVNGTVGTGC